MNDEIKVGEYVKLKGGYIGRIVNINDYRPPEQTYAISGISPEDVVFVGEGDIVYSSPNIIDLIEIGDYVNGRLVKRIGDYETFKRIDFEEYEDYIYEYDIKTIVTKEQMEKIMYRVEE